MFGFLGKFNLKVTGIRWVILAPTVIDWGDYAQTAVSVCPSTHKQFIQPKLEFVAKKCKIPFSLSFNVKPI